MYSLRTLTHTSARLHTQKKHTLCFQCMQTHTSTHRHIPQTHLQQSWRYRAPLICFSSLWKRLPATSERRLSFAFWGARRRVPAFSPSRILFFLSTNTTIRRRSKRNLIDKYVYVRAKHPHTVYINASGQYGWEWPTPTFTSSLISICVKWAREIEVPREEQASEIRLIASTECDFLLWTSEAWRRGRNYFGVWPQPGGGALAEQINIQTERI